MKSPDEIEREHLAGLEASNQPKPMVPPSPVAFNHNTANARFPFNGQVHIDLLAPYTSGPNDEWALPAQHIMVQGVEAAEALRDFLTQAIEYSKEKKP